jgi:homoaconitase/3-isopropylmalate dehydratase large subunit
MVLLEALKKGLIRVFVEAGAIVLNPGRSLEGRAAHILAAGEKGLTTAADFPCDGEGDIYQVSSATAAASALSGQVTNPAGRVRI